MRLRRKDLHYRIAKETGLTVTETKQVADRIFDYIIEALATGDNVEWRGFGIFEIRIKNARPAMDMKRHKPVMIPERVEIRFKQGKEMKAALSKNKDVIKAHMIANPINARQKKLRAANTA